MKKKLNLKVRSFGAEAGIPEAPELAAWAGRQQKVSCDLLSYQVEHSLLLQKDVDIPCTGGMYYRNRLSESITGIKNGFLREEPGLSGETISEDATRISACRRHAWMALPAPSALRLEDGYFRDSEEFYGALSEVWRRIMREMRDRGVEGHVLISDHFSTIEREELAGRKVFLFSPEGGSDVMAQILETQHHIAVPASRLRHLLMLTDEYDIRGISLLDGSHQDFRAANEYFDPDQIQAGGYCRAGESGYWQKIREEAWMEKP